MGNQKENSPLFTASYLAQKFGEESQLAGKVDFRDQRNTRFVAAVGPSESRLMTAVIEFADSLGKFSWFIHQHPDRLQIDGYEVRHGKLYASYGLSTLKFKWETSFLDLIRPYDIDFDHPETQNDYQLGMLMPEWTSEKLVEMAAVGQPTNRPTPLPHVELLRAMKTLGVRPSTEEN